jgi:PKD repeat protein
MRDGAVSDTVGAIVLITVVVIGISIASIAVLSQPTPQKIPALSADITAYNNGIQIRHEGGDPLDYQSTSILVDGTDLKDSFVHLDGTRWATWSVGDSLYYISGQPLPQSVQILYTGGSSSQVIQSFSVPSPIAGGTVGLPSIVPEPTPVATTSPTPTPTPVPPLPVTADFTGLPIFGYTPLTVQFTDASTGPVTSRSWVFGDGGTSTSQNPSHQYTTDGTYTVGLTVSNGSAGNTMTKTGYVTVTSYSPGLIANYYTNQNWLAPASATNVATRIQFADNAGQAIGYLSDVNNWPLGYIGIDDHFSVQFDGYLYIPAQDTYTFYLTSDDGSYMSLDGTQVIDDGGDHSATTKTVTLNLSSGFHPISVKMYENAGQAVVNLKYTTPTVTTQTLVTSLYHIPSTPPAPDFTEAPTAGNAPLAVQFTDASIDATSWTWNFGDGTPVSNAQNPSHTYTPAGTYNVTLLATNSFGSNTAIKNNYISVGAWSPGFFASYYYGQTWTSLAGTRVDNEIRYADAAGQSQGDPSDEANWPNSIVGQQDNFSVTWDGYLLVPANDTYTFSLRSDDGSYLWVDGNQLINNGGLHSATTVTGTVPLTLGYHHIVVNMFENTGEAVAQLQYSTLSQPTLQQVTNVWHV